MKGLVFGIGILTAASAAAQQAVTCPAEIAVEQRLAKPVAGWASMLDSYPHRLAGITFYDGPPEEKASLVASKGTKAGKKETAIWIFDAPGGRRNWLTCSYSGTTVVLKKELPASTKKCSVIYDTTQKVAGLPFVEKITCE